jgi:hypothetical protein
MTAGSGAAIPHTLDADPALAALIGEPAPEPEPRPTRLTVHRTSPRDVGQRQVIVSLDGRRIAELLFGETFTCEIVPGSHRLRAHNTLVWRTAEFVAAAGAHVHFTCVNRAPRGMYFMLVLFGVAPLFLTLKPGLPQFVRQ